MKILIIEDDPTLNEQLAQLLQRESYQVQQSYDGDDGLSQACSGQFNLILLDVMLPKRDGYALLSMLRKTSQTPVIMLTAKGAEEERIKGLSQGADDYVTKPFNTTELLLRIEALLRRSAGLAKPSPKELSLDGLFLNANEQSVTLFEQPIEFTPIQFNLLWELLFYQGELLNKAHLYQKVLKRNLGAYDRSLDMHLSRVRRKLNDGNWSGERLQTIHGKGYCLS